MTATWTSDMGCSSVQGVGTRVAQACCSCNCSRSGQGDAWTLTGDIRITVPTPPPVDVRRAADRYVTVSPGIVARHALSFGSHYDPGNTSHGDCCSRTTTTWSHPDRQLTARHETPGLSGRDQSTRQGTRPCCKWSGAAAVSTPCSTTCPAPATSRPDRQSSAGGRRRSPRSRPRGSWRIAGGLSGRQQHAAMAPG